MNCNLIFKKNVLVQKYAWECLKVPLSVMFQLLSKKQIPPLFLYLSFVFSCILTKLILFPFGRFLDGNLVVQYSFHQGWCTVQRMCTMFNSEGSASPLQLRNGIGVKNPASLLLSFIFWREFRFCCGIKEYCAKRSLRSPCSLLLIADYSLGLYQTSPKLQLFRFTLHAQYMVSNMRWSADSQQNINSNWRELGIFRVKININIYYIGICNSLRKVLNAWKMLSEIRVPESWNNYICTVAKINFHRQYLDNHGQKKNKSYDWEYIIFFTDIHLRVLSCVFVL